MYEKFTNLSQKESNAKINKKASVRNDVMATIIKRCRGEKQQGNLLTTIIPLKNILLGFIKLILIFMNAMKKRQFDDNGCKYIFFQD